MPWLNVPHLQQSEAGWCLPACVAMVAAYWKQPLTQADIARWLDTRGVGTPAMQLCPHRPDSSSSRVMNTCPLAVGGR